MNGIFRPFRAEDQAAARNLILGGLTEHFGFLDETLNPDLDDIKASYVDKGGFFLVCEVDGVLAGTGGLAVGEPGAARIVRVSVAPMFRRRGIAAALVRRLIQEASLRGITTVLVESNRDWCDAIRLYQRLGFTESARDSESVYLSLSLSANQPSRS
jgi:GNAT superfamily N-acetyltransferase